MPTQPAGMKVVNMEEKSSETKVADRVRTAPKKN